MTASDGSSLADISQQDRHGSPGGRATRDWPTSSRAGPAPRRSHGTAQSPACAEGPSHSPGPMGHKKTPRTVMGANAAVTVRVARNCQTHRRPTGDEGGTRLEGAERHPAALGGGRLAGTDPPVLPSLSPSLGGGGVWFCHVRRRGTSHGVPGRELPPGTRPYLLQQGWGLAPRPKSPMPPAGPGGWPTPTSCSALLARPLEVSGVLWCVP